MAPDFFGDLVLFEHRQKPGQSVLVQNTGKTFADAALGALEPHFATRLCEAAGVTLAHPVKDLFKPATGQAIESFFASQTRAQLDKLATAKDIPLLTLPR